jgi:hypothetical protein
MEIKMMKLTKAQQRSLKRKFEQQDTVKSYLDFRRTVAQMIAEDTIVVKWCNMWVAIEPDGHCHT